MSGHRSEFARTAMRTGRFAGVFIVFGFSVGCAMGPNFERPAAPTVQKYTLGPQAEKTVDSGTEGGGVQQFLPQQTIPKDWWTLFKSERLNQLIERGLMNSPTLASAQARLQQAAEILLAYDGSTRYPQIDAALSASR